jgi:hypothetical protein
VSRIQTPGSGSADLQRPARAVLIQMANRTELDDIIVGRKKKICQVIEDQKGREEKT